MSADPQELNRRCAELTGWRCYCGHDWLPPGKGMFAEHTEPLPDFCGSADAALLLVAELRNRGWTVRIDDGPTRTWSCGFIKEGIGNHYYAPGQTFCLAIVTAFLAVQEVGV